jgi:tetratricopeptide (TPR) repeat protein
MNEEDRNISLLSTVRWLIKHENWQQAYGVAQLLTESYEKSEALQAVAEYLVAIGHLEKAFLVFDEAQNIALAESLAAWQQAELLHRIAQSLRQMKAFFKADAVWEKAVAIAQTGEESSHRQDSLDAASTLAEIALDFAEHGRIEKAFSLAQKIKNVGKKEITLRRIADVSQQIKQVA